MESPNRLVYFPDCPRDEVACRCLSLLLGPIHLFPAPGEPPHAFLNTMQEAGSIILHSAPGISEKEVRRLLTDWETWARTLDKVDLATLKTLLQEGAAGSETSASLLREIKSYGTEGEEGAGKTGLAQTLVLHWARRLAQIRSESRSLMDEVDLRESSLKSLFGTSEDVEEPGVEIGEGESSDRGGAGAYPLPWESDFVQRDEESPENVVLELSAWDFFYQAVPGDCLVTDREDVILQLLDRCEAEEIVSSQFPFPDSSTLISYMDKAADADGVWKGLFEGVSSEAGAASRTIDGRNRESLRLGVYEAREALERIWRQEGIPVREDARLILHMSLRLVEGSAFGKFLPTGSGTLGKASKVPTSFQIPCIFFGVRNGSGSVGGI